jgi:putative two-component system response regulator
MKRILVVDDNIASLRQIGAQLAGRYVVTLAKSGTQALGIIAQARPDLILLDVAMPGMDGFETNEAIKADEDAAKIPVIFLTGSNDAETEIRALESGAVDFIAKPVEKEILIHRLGLHLALNDYHSNLERTVKELEDSIVLSFADLVDCKSNSTGGHVLRTGRYAGIIGMSLLRLGSFGDALDREYVEMTARAAPFHDIGKIGVSDVILRKPGPLTPEEYETAKRHTVIGAKVMDDIYKRTPTQKYLKLASVMAEDHHERYDGGGYPSGLKGEDIPLCARVVAAANAYDACLTERVYKKPLSEEKAYEYIMSGAGTRFDPRVVEAFNAAYYEIVAVDRTDAGLCGCVGDSEAARTVWQRLQKTDVSLEALQ